MGIFRKFEVLGNLFATIFQTFNLRYSILMFFHFHWASLSLAQLVCDTLSGVTAYIKEVMVLPNRTD